MLLRWVRWYAAQNSMPVSRLVRLLLEKLKSDYERANQEEVRQI